jgi:hypothetical protein
MKLTPLFSASLLILALGTPLHAQTLNWGSEIGTFIVDSDGDGVDDRFVFELGAFDLNFTPDESNYELWFENWRMFDSTTYNSEFGYYTSTVHVISDLNGEGVFSSNPEASPENFSELVAYLWIRNADLPGSETEWLLVRADNWFFPRTGGDCCDTSVNEWSTSDLTDTNTPLYGSQGGIPGDGEKTFNSTTGLQTFTFVPEPSTAVLAALGALALLRRRRDNH